MGKDIVFVIDKDLDKPLFTKGKDGKIIVKKDKPSTGYINRPKKDK